MQDHLASGDIAVERTSIPADDRGVDITVAKMMEMARGQFGARSAKIRALVINVVNAAGAPDKDYFAMSEAIHNWVRDNIRYVKDPVGQETLSYPEETAFNSKAGDCDDKTILEIAMLGAVGILAYPVVIGLDPRVFSHVYLHIVLPPGKYKNAGMTIAADPIMREWPLGREAPGDKVKRRKIYPQLLAGLGMLGSYAEGPSYLDEENTASVQPALDRGYVSAGQDQQGDGGVQAIDAETDGMDAMFGGANVEKIIARGPMTAGMASNETRRLHTKHKIVTADGDFSPRADISMVGSRDAAAPSDEEINAISQIVEEAAAGAAPFTDMQGLGSDTTALQAAAAHYAEVKAQRAAARAQLVASRKDYANTRKAVALAGKARAVANKAHAFAARSASLDARKQRVLMQGNTLLAQTKGTLVDMADANPVSTNLVTDTRASVHGLAAALAGLAGAPGREDERLAGLGMVQSGNVLFGLSGDLMGADNQFAGVGDLDAKTGGIRRLGRGLFSAPRSIWKGATRMLARKRAGANDRRDIRARPNPDKKVGKKIGWNMPISTAKHPGQPVNGLGMFDPPAFPAADESLLSRPTDSPEGFSASGCEQPVQAYGPEQMGPLERNASALPPIEEPRTVDAEVVPASESDAPGEVAAGEDIPTTIEGLGQMTTTTKIGIGAGGLAVIGLLAYFLLRKK
jgi:hypothetical protein